MDLFSVLQNSLSPAKTLESAVLQNDITLLEQTLQKGVSVNCRVQVQGGNTALHLAAHEGLVLCMEKLLQYNADPDKENDFNISPVTMAFKKKRPRCLELLLEKSTSWLNLDSFWLRVDVASQLWNASNSDSTASVISLLIKASPDFSQTRSNLKQNLFYRCKDMNFTSVLKIFRMAEDLENESFITSKKSSFDQSINEQKLFVAWLDTYNKMPPSLAHFARLTIRKSFHSNCNVFYGVNQLVIPTALKHFITMRYD